MNKISIVLFSLIALIFTSCEKITGEGPVETVNRSVSPFAGIDLRCSASVYFTQSPDYKVEVSAQRNILDVLETYVSDNKLVVKFKNGVNVRSHEAIRVIVSAPTLRSLRVSGSGNINVTGPFNPSMLDMDISGSGSILISELHTDFMDAKISGSGNIKVVSGTATEETLKISGSGNLDLTDVVAARIRTMTSGSGNIKVTATENLDVTISGSGDVFYKGSPAINLKVSGSGKVVHL
ncbi:MAG TPA: head GIN domain-containing protein [Flavisolibacter sp.]|jgi:hypothetical protein|nr:head GIN domain-containing protein [Flavisolibacter sp.]